MRAAVAADDRTGSDEALPRSNQTPRRKRLVLLGALAAVAAGILVVSLMFPRAGEVRARLEQGRRTLETARGLLLDGNPARALEAFHRATETFDSAAEDARSGGLSLIAHVPILGRTVDAVAAVADAGRATSRAGETLASAFQRIGGLDGLAPVHGRIPLGRVAELGTAADRAHELVASALDAVRSAPTSLVLPPVDDARDLAEHDLGEVEGTLGTAAPLLHGLPAFLGGDGTRTYLFGASSLAEIRGSGGLIGAYALVRADDGRLSFSRFRPVASLPLLSPSAVPAPNPDYATNWDPMRTGHGFWLNVNMTPDFPSAAVAFERGFERAMGQPLDGVVVADPFALQALLRSTGPTTIPSLGKTIDAGDVVPFLANEAYARFPSSKVRKKILGAVASSVVQRFLAIGPSAGGIRAIADSASQSHILLYSDDPSFRSALERTGAGGAFRGPAGGFFSIVQNNASATKFDYYADRTAAVRVDLLGDGSALAHIDVRLTNHAPTSGLPPQMLVPQIPHGRPGENVALLNVYCGRCSLGSASLDGRPFEPGSGSELGQTFYQSYDRIPSGQTSDVSYGVRVASAWDGSGTGGTYRLTFLNQVTMRPTELHLQVRAPDGMRFTSASDGMHVDGDVATWTGVPDRTLDLDMTFAPPWPVRWWRSLTDLF
jgi:Protein of unknown function (DUF4012)